MFLKLKFLLIYFFINCRRASKRNSTSTYFDDDNNVEVVPLNAAGMKCEDSPLVEASGIKCSLLARNIGSLGCDKIIQDLANERGRSLDNIPTIFRTKRIADACPETCGLCTYCAPGCVHWFINNGWCEEACNNAECQFDGGDCWDRDCKVGKWSSWSQCSHVCGPDGYRVRKRSIIVKPLGNGQPCPKLEDKEFGCSKHILCPVACIPSEWSDWSDCTAECGLGETIRSRDILVEAQHNGKNCTDLTQKAVCLKKLCPIDCEVSDWTPWSECSEECGIGFRARFRTVLVEPANGGKNCHTLYEEETCNAGSCDDLRDCKLTKWSNWSECSKLCGGGSRYRSREIISGICSNIELKQSQDCNENHCLDSCIVSQWSNWSNCDADCGYGKMYRYRDVLNMNDTDLANCPHLVENAKCFSRSCEEICMLSDWSEWSACNTSSNQCGVGFRKRTRTVLNLPQTNLKTCETIEQFEDCEVECIDETAELNKCEYEPWTDWTNCSKKCGPEISQRHKIAITPKCDNLVEQRTCRNEKCEQKCLLSDWSEWSNCNKICGVGYKKRNRTILQLPLGSQSCGILEDYIDCEDQPCDVDCQYTNWSGWSDCVGDCNAIGHRTRSRKVIKKNTGISSKKCVGPLIEKESCLIKCNDDANIYMCKYGEWDNWTECTEPCGEGLQTRGRVLIDGDANICINTKQTKPCFIKSCDIDCQLSNWSNWSDCSASCGIGERARFRKILTLPRNNGYPCDKLIEIENCFIKECRINNDCVLSDWSEWSECTVSCGGGVKSRKREILVEKILNGTCGITEQITGCNLQRCPDTPCEDNARITSNGISCGMLATQGCSTNIRTLAKENGIEDQIPKDVPPQARIQDACPKTCNVCAECAPGCQLRDLGNTVCTEECNNENCEYDKGDCGGDCKLIDYEVNQDVKFVNKKTSYEINEELIIVCPKNQVIAGNELYFELPLICNENKEIKVNKNKLLDTFTKNSAIINNPLESIHCVDYNCVFLNIIGIFSYEDINNTTIYNGIYERVYTHESNGLLYYQKNTGFTKLYYLEQYENAFIISDLSTIPSIVRKDIKNTNNINHMNEHYSSNDQLWYAINGQMHIDNIQSLSQFDINSNKSFTSGSVTCLNERKPILNQNTNDYMTKIIGNSNQGFSTKCENLSFVEKFSKLTCDKLVSTVGCMYELKNNGKLPPFLDQTATLATVCPYSCNACENQCSIGCFDWFINNGYCDKPCNVESCGFDGSDCIDVEVINTDSMAQTDLITTQLNTSNLTGSEYVLTDIRKITAISKDQDKQLFPMLFYSERQYYNDCRPDSLIKYFGVTCADIINMQDINCDTNLHDLLSRYTKNQDNDIKLPNDYYLYDLCPNECDSCNKKLHRDKSIKNSDNFECVDSIIIEFLTDLKCSELVYILNKNCSIPITAINIFNDFETKTQLYDVCPNSCGKCNNNNTQELKCADFKIVQSFSGFTCNEVYNMLGSSICNQPITELAEDLPFSLEFELLFSAVCPLTCKKCINNEIIMNSKPNIELLEIDQTCHDIDLLNKYIGINCENLIKDNDSCEKTVVDAGLWPTISQQIDKLYKDKIYISKLSQLSTLCQKSCSSCVDSTPEDECKDRRDLLEGELYTTCKYLINNFGCAASLKYILKTYTNLPKLIIDQFENSLTIENLCNYSCERCIQYKSPNTCTDNEILRKYGLNCSTIVLNNNSNCDAYIEDIDRNYDFLYELLSNFQNNEEKIKDICAKTCNYCGSKAKVVVQKFEEQEMIGDCNDSPILKEFNATCGMLSKIFTAKYSIGKACETDLHFLLSGTSYLEKIPKNLKFKHICKSTCSQCGPASCNDGFKNGNEDWIDCGGNCRSCEHCKIVDLKKAIKSSNIQYILNHSSSKNNYISGSNIEIGCLPGFIFEGGSNLAECYDDVWYLPPSNCKEETIEVTIIKLIYDNWQISSYLFALAHHKALVSIFRDMDKFNDTLDIRTLKAGLCSSIIYNDNKKVNCEDDERVTNSGISCSILASAGCDQNIHDLAKILGQVVPDFIPIEAIIADACPKTCNMCDVSESRKLQFELQKLRSNGVIDCYEIQIGIKYNTKKISESGIDIIKLIRAKYISLDKFKAKLKGYIENELSQYQYLIDPLHLNDINETIQYSLKYVSNNLLSALRIGDAIGSNDLTTAITVKNITKSAWSQAVNILSAKEKWINILLNNFDLSLFSFSIDMIDLLRQSTDIVYSETLNDIVGIDDAIILLLSATKQYKFNKNYKLILDRENIKSLLHSSFEAIKCQNFQKELNELLNSKCDMLSGITKYNKANFVTLCMELDSFNSETSIVCSKELRFLLNKYSNSNCSNFKQFTRVLKLMCHKNYDGDLCIFSLLDDVSKLNHTFYSSSKDNLEFNCEINNCYHNHIKFMNSISEINLALSIYNIVVVYDTIENKIIDIIKHANGEQSLINNIGTDIMNNKPEYYYAINDYSENVLKLACSLNSTDSCSNSIQQLLKYNPLKDLKYFINSCESECMQFAMYSLGQLLFEFGTAMDMSNITYVSLAIITLSEGVCNTTNDNKISCLELYSLSNNLPINPTNYISNIFSKYNNPIKDCNLVCSNTYYADNICDQQCNHLGCNYDGFDCLILNQYKKLFGGLLDSICISDLNSRNCNHLKSNFKCTDACQSQIASCINSYGACYYHAFRMLFKLLQIDSCAKLNELYVVEKKLKSHLMDEDYKKNSANIDNIRQQVDIEYGKKFSNLESICETNMSTKFNSKFNGLFITLNFYLNNVTNGLYSTTEQSSMSEEYTYNHYDSDSYSTAYIDNRNKTTKDTNLRNNEQSPYNRNYARLLQQSNHEHVKTTYFNVNYKNDKTIRAKITQLLYRLFKNDKIMILDEHIKKAWITEYDKYNVVITVQFVFNDNIDKQKIIDVTKNIENYNAYLRYLKQLLLINVNSPSKYSNIKLLDILSTTETRKLYTNDFYNFETPTYGDFDHSFQTYLGMADCRSSTIKDILSNGYQIDNTNTGNLFLQPSKYNYNHGESINVKCITQNKNRDFKTSELQCINGAWILKEMLFCEKSCKSNLYKAKDLLNKNLEIIHYDTNESFAELINNDYKDMIQSYLSKNELEYLFLNNLSVTSRSAIIISCIQGYRPNAKTNNKGTSVIMCYDGSWMGSFPYCSKGCSSLPEFLLNNIQAYKIKGNNKYYGSRLIISCKNGYNAKPLMYEKSETIIECQKNGNWSDPLFTCMSGMTVDPLNQPSSVTKIAKTLINKVSLTFIALFICSAVIFGSIVAVIWKRSMRAKSTIELKNRENLTQNFIFKMHKANDEEETNNVFINFSNKFDELETDEIANLENYNMTSEALIRRPKRNTLTNENLNSDSSLDAIQRVSYLYSFK